MSQSEFVDAGEKLKAEALIAEIDSWITVLTKRRNDLESAIRPPVPTVAIAIRQIKWLRSQNYADGKAPYWSEYGYMADLQGRENPGAKTLELAIRQAPTGILVFSDFEYSLSKNGKAINRRSA